VKTDRDHPFRFRRFRLDRERRVSFQPRYWGSGSPTDRWASSTVNRIGSEPVAALFVSVSSVWLWVLAVLMRFDGASRMMASGDDSRSGRAFGGNGIDRLCLIAITAENTPLPKRQRSLTLFPNPLLTTPKNRSRTRKVSHLTSNVSSSPASSSKMVELSPTTVRCLVPFQLLRVRS
jgi:hypothetical protein